MVSASPGHKAKGLAPRPPPPAISAPMTGEPEAATLSEARLVPSSCNDFQGRRKAVVDARVKAMRARMAESYKTWHDAQPSCWEENRREAEVLKMLQKGEGYGYGYGHGGMVGLGLSASGSGSGSIGGGASHSIRMGASVGPRAPTAATSYSHTNNQVASVDEADIVKTDGKYVYFAMNGALRIAEAMNPRMISVTKLAGSVRELFVEGNRAVVYVATREPRKPCTYGYDCVFAGDGTGTKVVVLDVEDRAHPRVIREVAFTGSLMSARRVGNVVHTVVADGDSQGPAFESWPAGLATCGTPEATVRKKFDKLTAENEAKIRTTTQFPTMRDGATTTSLCDALLRTKIDDGQSFTTVASFDLTKDHEPVTTATLESRPGAVFASERGLYMSVAHQKTVASKGGRGSWYSFYSNVDEASEIHQFRIGERASDTKYLGSGVVPGHVLNQFAMDEWYGYLRVATTKGRVPDPRVESVVSILAPSALGNLVRVGAVDHIAPGEDIRSVRFDDDRGYVVTFNKTDPLFVLDLDAPDRPRILGELKIPGFSTYMHRIDRDHLMSIGFDANDHGNFAYFDGVILQLFDVKDPTKPTLLHKEKIGTRGSSSEAATNHLAFNYFADKGLLAVPMTVCSGGGDGVAGSEVSFSGLYVYDVDLEKGFQRLGGIDHAASGANKASCQTWWSNANSAVKRSIFLDDLVYSISGDAAKVQRMGHFGTNVASLSLLE